MVLFTNAEWISKLVAHRQHATQPVHRLAVLKEDLSSGELRPTGGQALKDSQSYTPEFGDAIAKLFTQHRKAWRDTRPSLPKRCRCAGECPSAEVLLTTPLMRDELWEDANLQMVLSISKAKALRVAPGMLVETISSDSD
jgi:hypothetical protein